MEITQREAELLTSNQGRHCLKLLQSEHHDEYRFEILSDAVVNLMDLGLEKSTMMGILDRSNVTSSDAIMENAGQIFVQDNRDELRIFLDTFDTHLFNVKQISIDDNYIKEIPIPERKSFSLYSVPLQSGQDQVTIITAPIGSGKSTATAKSISKALQDDLLCIENVLVICPRNKSCDQFVELLERNGTKPNRYYGSHKGKDTRGVTVTNFDNAPKLLLRIAFDWIIIDDFHALWDDSTFRRSQNEKLTNTLILAMQRSSADLYFLSATPRKEVLTPFFNACTGSVKGHSYSVSRETKTVNFYRTKDVNASLVQIVLNSDVRCIVHNNNIVANAKIAAYLIERGKRVLQVHAGTKDSFESISDYDCILTTNFIDSGFSIDDGIPSIVLVTASISEGLIPLVQRLGRTRENVEEYAIIIKKRKHKANLSRQMDNMQTWNCGWNYDECDVPTNWSYGRRKRGDYLEKSEVLNKAISEGDYLNKILEVPALRDLYNKGYAREIGFFIGGVHEFNPEPIELDMFIKEVREIFQDLSCECDTLILLASLVRVAPNKNDVPEAVNRLCIYMQAQNNFDGEIIDRISQRLLEKFGSHLIVSDAYKEIVGLCVGILSTYSLDKETLIGLEIPLTVDEWMSSNPKERFKYIQRCEQALASLFAVADTESPRPHKMDPIKFNVGKIFNRWIKHVVESGETSFTPKALEEFVNRFTCRGYLAMHSNKYFANLNYIDRGKIYQCFKTSVKWICRREKIGTNVYFIVDSILLEKFIILLKSLGVMWERLTEEQFNLPRYLKYDSNLRRSVILCHPLFNLVAELI